MSDGFSFDIIELAADSNAFGIIKESALSGKSIKALVFEQVNDP